MQQIKIMKLFKYIFTPPPLCKEIDIMGIGFVRMLEFNIRQRVIETISRGAMIPVDGDTCFFPPLPIHVPLQSISDPCGSIYYRILENIDYDTTK